MCLILSYYVFHLFKLFKFLASLLFIIANFTLIFEGLLVVNITFIRKIMLFILMLRSLLAGLLNLLLLFFLLRFLLNSKFLKQ